MDAAVRTVLEDAYELLKDPDHFTVNVEAKDVNGFGVGANAPEAVRWCAIGAVAKVMDCNLWHYTGDVGHEAVNILSAKAREIFPELVDDGLYLGIVIVNNDKGHEAVMQVFEKVLAEDGGLPL